LSWITLDGKGEEITGEKEIKDEIATLGLGEISENASPKLEITICWKPTLPLMNKAGYEGIGVDMLPVTSGVADDKLSLVLAGSSIKGAFRSHAERIVRTLNPTKYGHKESFNDQIDEIDFVENLFGERKKTLKTDDDNQDEKERREKARKKRLGLGALSIDDCHSIESFDQANWREVEQSSVDKDETYTTFLSKLSQIEKANLRFYPTQHTAIDRFTGGVADGALYSVLAPHNIEWQPIRMSLDFGRADGKDKCCLMLLLLILRDLAENRLPLGFATNRGMGEIEVGKIEITESYNIVWQNGKFEFADEKQKSEITEEWKKCVAWKNQS
jgi:CRISPR/Cas system CSM-associated protein Csm3 (group 7 of RAMP superfamily)